MAPPSVFSLTSSSIKPKIEVSDYTHFGTKNCFEDLKNDFKKTADSFCKPFFQAALSSRLRKCLH
jgi:hypothetical protein